MVNKGFKLKVMKEIAIFFVFTCVMGLMFTSASAQEISIPAWIKNNAGWWADGQIPDSTFVQGIEFLIEKEIIVIPNMPKASSDEAESIPAWIKNNAGWWANDQIDDVTFVGGIEYLIQIGIIIVQQPENTDELVYFATQPSDVKLYDTRVVSKSAYSLDSVIRYIETVEIDNNGQEFNQIWLEVNSIASETIRFSYVKNSENVIDEYDGVKLLLVKGLIKSDNKIESVNIYVEEYENNRIVKYIETDISQIFRQVMEPKYFM
jgi:hypothetical protein